MSVGRIRKALVRADVSPHTQQHTVQHSTDAATTTTPLAETHDIYLQLRGRILLFFNFTRGAFSAQSACAFPPHRRSKNWICDGPVVPRWREPKLKGRTGRISHKRRPYTCVPSQEENDRHYDAWYHDLAAASLYWWQSRLRSTWVQ